MERAHYWYYMLELGFYGSLLLRISVDVKRKVRMLHIRLRSAPATRSKVFI